MKHEHSFDLTDKSNKSKQYLATICVSLAGTCAGATLAWTSPVTPQIQLPDNETFYDGVDFKISTTECGIVSSMLALGALISSIPAGFLAEKFGRKYVIMSLSILFLINWLCLSFATNAITLYIGRFFAGLGTGAICVCAPMYIGEIAEADIRGKLGSFFQMFLCGGILLTYALGAILDWRTLSMALGATPILFLAAFFKMPETPIYLVKTSNIKEAANSLKFLRGPYYNYQPEIDNLRSECFEAERNKSALSDLYKSKGNRRALISALGVMFFQQFSGINAVIFYTVPIFKSAGEMFSAEISTILVGGLQLVAAYAATIVIEKANRKFFLTLSSGIMMICLFALGIYFHVKSNNIENAILNFLPIASVLLFIVAFSLGFGPIPWMILSELFAPEIKGIASGIAVMTNWILVFIITFAFPLIDALGHQYPFYIFGAFMAAAILFINRVLPETRGKSLQEIQRILNF